MLSRLLGIAANLPDIWGEGTLFAFSGLDGRTDTRSGFVGTYAREPYDLLFHTPRRRRLEIRLPTPGTPRIAASDVLAVETPAGELVAAYTAWHTLAGMVPPGTCLRLSLEDGPEATGHGPYRLSPDPGSRDVLVLAEREGRFALAYGISVDEARERAGAGLAADLEAVASRRLAIYRQVPALGSRWRNRLLSKCVSVMKVNALAAEGTIRQAWSTPDRVPHRDMWLWDSVFHSLVMNRFNPAVAWQYLKSVLDTQGPDGMIPHQAAASGARSPITQPPLLAWGVWENYQALGERDCLAYALPRLERYLEWDLAHRDRNANGLLEWLIEETVRCRSGESGMDNSPRFDRFLRLDAVDFSVYAAHDMRYLSHIAAELGQAAQAKAWRARAVEMAARVHRHLWDEAQGFYFDLDSRGELSPVWAVSGFWPLLLDDIPSERISRLVRALQNPATFNTAFPVPSVAVCDPAWSTDMWRGATWVNTNYLVILGLRRHGRREVARWLSESTIAMVAKYYERLGVLFEFYDAKDELPPPLCDRKGRHRGVYDIRKKMDSIRDYHWTAALTACLLLDQDGQSPRRCP